MRIIPLTPNLIFFPHKSTKPTFHVFAINVLQLLIWPKPSQ